MDAIEEFDSSSDEENFDNEWKFDENDDVTQYMDNSTIPLYDNIDMESRIGKETIERPSLERPSKAKVSRMDLNTAKAGMEGLDKEKINQIIHEASKGSKFYENEKKKEKQVQKRIQELQRKMASFSDEQRIKAKQTADKIVLELEQFRDLSRTIVHVDMDAFYAAVEMLDDPSLKTKPMAVGGNAMLCTSNYLARRYGVRAGMPGFIAKKLCPNLTIVPTNFDKYTKISHEIREVLAEYDKNFLPMSLDEAYLDITEYLSTSRCKVDSMGQEMGETTDKETGLSESKMKSDESDSEFQRTDAEKDPIVQGAYLPKDILSVASKIEVTPSADVEQVSNQPNCDKDKDTAEEKSVDDDNDNYHSLPHEEDVVDRKMFYNKVEEVVKEMRRKIEEKTQLTASAGIAANMFLAKVCSDKNKPNGQFYLKPERDKIMQFVRELPLRKAFGIGRVSEQILTSVLKVSTCSGLRERRDFMQLLFTETACRNYLEISLGLGSTVVDVDRERKSMSTETTFREINKPEEHFAKCRELCEELSDSLKTKGLTARKIGIKLKTIKFEVKTRVCTASYPVQESDEIFSHAKKLLVNEMRACSPQPLRLRLMGVRAAEFCQRGIANESKQQTITTLMKKSGRVPVRSENGETSQIAGASNTNVSKNEVSLNLSSGTYMLSDVPSTSKEHTDEQLPLNLSEDHDIQKIANMDVPSSVEQDVPKPNTFNCPVCGRDLTFSSGNILLQLNQHVDKCLSTQAITDILKNDPVQSTNREHEISKKRKRQSPNKAVKRRPMDRFLTKHAK